MPAVIITKISTAGAGSIDQGAQAVGVLNTGAAAITFNGQTVPVGQSINYPQLANRYYELLPFDATGSSAEITVFR